MISTNNSIVNLNYEIGMPSHDFFEKAWASEPLTRVLEGTDIPFALPAPDENISLVAKNEDGSVIGQCSANKVIKYWNHMENIDSSTCNIATQLFVSIHKKGVNIEKDYLKRLGEPIETSFHNAGIAVLPEYRGKKIGLSITAKQIELCKQHKITTLFCETTNRFSGAIVEKLGFAKISEFPYSKLAEELNYPSLKTLDDSFTVWCLRI